MNQYFLQEIKTLFKDEYEDFIATADRPMYRSLRVNPLKTTAEFLKDSGIEFGELTPFDSNTYYLDTENKLGNHPFHNAGLYYLQEPSATAAVTALQVRENDFVADLCAAPGGKSTQILNRLKGTGFLWSNEINWKRCQVLLSNLERWGYSNYLLTNLDTAEIANNVSGFFDKVLIDAPCSGASMFKKYPESVNDYNEANVIACQARQLEILENGYKILKKEGIIVYSTCTYNLIENEECVYKFLQKHPDMELVDTGLDCGRRGLPYKDLNTRLMTRILPMDKGEGHFICRMQKHGNSVERKPAFYTSVKDKTVNEFLKQYGIETEYYIKNDVVFTTSYPFMIKSGSIRNGAVLGNLLKGRFEPHHNIATCLEISSQFSQRYDIDSHKQLEAYLRGESIPVRGYKGYVLITYQNVPLGLAKGDNRQLKNHLPKGLRIQNVL